MRERLKQRKEELGMTTAALSKLSGVPIGTINKIFTGETKSPRLDTLTALEKVLFSEYASGVTYNFQNKVIDQPDCVRESAVVYTASKWDKKSGGQGTYTLDDYYALPEDVKAELIDGELIYMEAPDLVHQHISAELHFLLTTYIRQKQGNCLVFMAPLDVQLDCDNRTMVEPDVLVSCKKERRTARGIFGAPDMVIEITSPSTRKRDYSRKMVKYLEAGVREYWIVDLQKKMTIVYFFEEDMMPHIYSFGADVPVSIFNGECSADFEKMLERLGEMER